MSADDVSCAVGKKSYIFFFSYFDANVADTCASTAENASPPDSMSQTETDVFFLSFSFCDSSKNRNSPCFYNTPLHRFHIDRIENHRWTSHSLFKLFRAKLAVTNDKCKIVVLRFAGDDVIVSHDSIDMSRLPRNQKQRISCIFLRWAECANTPQAHLLRFAFVKWNEEKKTSHFSNSNSQIIMLHEMAIAYRALWFHTLSHATHTLYADGAVIISVERHFGFSYVQSFVVVRSTRFVFVFVVCLIRASCSCSYFID